LKSGRKARALSSVWEYRGAEVQRYRGAEV